MVPLRPHLSLLYRDAYIENYVPRIVQFRTEIARFRTRIVENRTGIARFRGLIVQNRAGSCEIVN
jgi:hypothetical protein